MAFTATILSTLLSFWPLLLFLVILALTVKLFKKNKPDPLAGIPEIKPHWISGNLDFSKNINFAYEQHYKRMKGLPYCTFYHFNEKRLFVLDPDICSKILITDFDHFEYVPFVPKDYRDAMGNQFGLVDSYGEAWKTMKKSVSGAFSIIRLKKSLPLYNSCCREMVKFLDSESGNDGEVDCVDMIKRCAINILGLVGFGMNINTYQDKNSELKKHADNLFGLTRFFGIMFIPNVMSFFRIPIFPPSAANFITNVIEKNMKSRENEESERKDILGTLIKVHKDNPKDITMDILIKTCLQFMGDGYTTTAESILAAMYMIAVNPEVEEKLKDEIDRVLEDKEDPDGDLTEEDINELSYLDMVFKETMRMATAGFSPRQCTKAWKVPNSDLIIPVGTDVVIPILGLQNDPEYWEDPEEFIPERFSEENRGKIRSGTYFPFGQGPRVCLGTNFARFEAKVIIAYLLKNFSIVGGDKLPKKLTLDPNTFLSPIGGLKLKFKKR